MNYFDRELKEFSIFKTKFSKNLVKTRDIPILDVQYLGII